MEKICKECYECKLNKYVYNVDLTGKEKDEYTRKQLEAVKKLGEKITVEELSKTLAIEYNKTFKPKDYSEIKSYYNQKILKLYSKIEKEIEGSEDPLLTSIKYALIGNYIDYDAAYKVDDDKLNELLNSVKERTIDLRVYENLKKDLAMAKSLVYLIDNCGEVVLDKLFMKQINKYYPQITIYGLVRKEDILNDATMVDAKEVGLEEVCIPLDNGNHSNRINLNKMDSDRKKLIDNADLVISKGQANAESLRGCGINIYYILLCKCFRFASSFGCNKFDSILARELD